MSEKQPIKKGLACISLIFLAGTIWTGCKDQPQPVQTTDRSGQTIYTSGKEKRTSCLLPDGTRVLMNANTVVRLPAGFDSTSRELFLDGEALFTIGPGKGMPFVVHTRALVTTVPDSAKAIGPDSLREAVQVKATFKVNGLHDSPGEEVDLLSGHLIVRKSYHSSTDNEPEQLGSGEMVMVNTDIDLMEKEVFDTAELKAWINGKEDKK